MTNLSSSNLTNITSRLSNTSMKGDTSNVLNDTSLVLLIIINSVTSPSTVLLNVLVILAVKRRPRLQTKTNILLACLAATDTFTGLVVQPSFILWKTLQLLGMVYRDTVGLFHSSLLRSMAICSSLHLMLVTCERLIAIRFTMHYPYIVISRNIKVAVSAFWIFSFLFVVFALIDTNDAVRSILNVLATLTVISCVLFITSAYVILYRETLRHRKMIKTQQLPQEEAQRFAKENRALKTTVLVVGSVVLCFIPIAFMVLLFKFLKFDLYTDVITKVCLPCSWVNTFVMLNSFVNPLIYCWRQKEMRQFVFRVSSAPVAPASAGSVNAQTALQLSTP